MLTITIPGDEVYVEATETFETVGDVVLELEHSLVALSKWEAKYEKPFLGKGDKTPEEVFGYVQAMAITPNVAPEVWQRLVGSSELIGQINDYINARSTATWFSEHAGASRNAEVITSELIYFWMSVYSLPVEYERWHLNRLFTIIRVANEKNAKPKKMSRTEQAQRNRELNEQRRAQLGTKG